MYIEVRAGVDSVLIVIVRLSGVHRALHSVDIASTAWSWIPQHGEVILTKI